jgi:hypothetical protein
MMGDARSLVEGGWCQGAQARDREGREVPAWSSEAHTWSVLGALLASWHRHEDLLGSGDQVVAHLADAEALGEATQALGEIVRTASLEAWNDDPARTQADVIAAFDRVLRLLEAR